MRPAAGKSCPERKQIAVVPIQLRGPDRFFVRHPDELGRHAHLIAFTLHGAVQHCFDSERCPISTASFSRFRYRDTELVGSTVV